MNAKGAQEKYSSLAFFNLAFCVVVILWGAYVRATGSGAGCGSHWPLCNGGVVPREAQVKTLIEFSHRLSSGLLLLLIMGQAIWAWRILEPRGFARRAAFLSLIAVIIEALIGAFIVLLGYVEHDKSIDRVLSMSMHLVNTLFLLAALTCAALSVGHPTPRWRWPVREERWWPRGLLLGFAALGGLGAVAALGDTLFPPSSVMGGILSDLSGQSHVAERIRILHPVFAVAWVGLAAYWIAGLWERIPALKGRGKLVLWVACTNLGLGLLNVLLLAPVWMQILHLFVADALWILFVSLLFSAASQQQWK